MILTNNIFEQEVKRIKIDHNDNFVILDMVIEDKEVILVNIYGPNNKRPQFYENLKLKIKHHLVRC